MKKFFIAKNFQNKGISRHIINMVFLELKIVKSGSYGYKADPYMLQNLSNFITKSP